MQNASYDELYQLTSEQITDATVGNRTIDYTYDRVGNRLTRNDSSEGMTSYNYDANDRLLTETLAGAVTRYTYDNNGNTLSGAQSTTDQTLYHWNADGRLVGADIIAGGVAKQVVYDYNVEGIRVLSKADGLETRLLIDTVQPHPQVVMEYRPSGLILASYVYGKNLISRDLASQALRNNNRGAFQLPRKDDVVPIAVELLRLDSQGQLDSGDNLP